MGNRQPEIEPVGRMELTAGDCCLDFVNTGSRLLERHAHLSGEALAAEGPFGDRLASYDDLVTFAERTGLIGTEGASMLRTRAAAEAKEAAAVVEAARELRETLYRTFASAAAGVPAEAADLARLRRAAVEAASRQQLVPADSGYQLNWPDAPELDRVLWPIASSALTLLLSEEVRRVKQCASRECKWLFLDSSRNQSRRWCDMKACGNRAKAHNYYHRHQGVQDC